MTVIILELTSVMKMKHSIEEHSTNLGQTIELAIMQRIALKDQLRAVRLYM